MSRHDAVSPGGAVDAVDVAGHELRSRSDDEIRTLFDRLDNRGRWGVDDELGTLNHITPDKRREAAQLVRTGCVLSLAHPLEIGGTPRGAHLERQMFYNREAGGSGPPFAGDHFGMDTHQQEVTHLDCVSHIGSHEGRTYNGRPFAEVATSDGLTFGSIHAQRAGIFTRGVLLDVAAACGREWLDPGHEITPDEMEQAAAAAGVEVSCGDVVVVRAGVEPRERSEGWSPLLAGPGPDVAAWLHDHEVAAYTGDAPEHITERGAVALGRLSDDAIEHDRGATEFPLPFHQVAIPAMGLVLLDHARVEELAAYSREVDRHEFLFVVAPLVMPGGSGSPVNPLAAF